MRACHYHEYFYSNPQSGGSGYYSYEDTLNFSYIWADLKWMEMLPDKVYEDTINYGSYSFIEMWWNSDMQLFLKHRNFYDITLDWVDSIATLFLFNQRDDVFYTKGCGITKRDYYFAPSSLAEDIDYFQKSGQQWGIPCYCDTLLILGLDNFTPAKTNHAAVYPNPSSGSLTVVFEHDQSQSAVFEILDLVGKSVFEIIISANSTTIDISMLQSGIYIYCVKDVNRPIETGKLIIR